MPPQKRVHPLRALTDRFTDVWKLLSETTQFLSMAGELGAYESQLRRMRQALQSRKDDNTLHAVKEELIHLRKHLRMQGYDLSLVHFSIHFQGFKHDDSMREGFRRVVIVITDRNLYWLKGDENHISLAESLERQLETILDHEGRERILDRHYLWYRRDGKQLILGGSATESVSDFARLTHMVEARPLFFLDKLRDLT